MKCQPDTVGHVECTGDAGGSHLARAVPDDRVGNDAPRAPQRSQGHLQAQVGDLGDVRLGEPRLVLGGVHLVEQPSVSEGHARRCGRH